MMKTVLSEAVLRDMDSIPEGRNLRKFHATFPRMSSGDKDEMIAFFEDHCDKVVKSIPAERLLIFRAGDGWEPLCAFLGVPVPAGDYPHTNDGESFQEEWSKRFERLFGEKDSTRIS